MPPPRRARPPLRFPWPTDARGAALSVFRLPPTGAPTAAAATAAAVVPTAPPPPPPPPLRRPPLPLRPVPGACVFPVGTPPAARSRVRARGSPGDARGVATSILCHFSAACTRGRGRAFAPSPRGGAGGGCWGRDRGVGGCVWVCVGVFVCVRVCVCVCRTVLAPPVGDPTGRRRVICRTWSARGRRGGRRDAITPPAAVPALAPPPQRVTVADARARARAPRGGGARPEGAPAVSVGAAGSRARAGGYNSPRL